MYKIYFVHPRHGTIFDTCYLEHKNLEKAIAEAYLLIPRINMITPMSRNPADRGVILTHREARFLSRETGKWFDIDSNPTEAPNETL